MANQFDVTIIGTGPGGYVCAIRCAQLGLKVAVVEKRKSHGGTCLNVGCIPSKALLHASELYAESKHAFARMGIKAETSVDFPQMMNFKQEAIDGNTKGIDFLLKKNKVTVFHGTGKIAGPGKVSVGSEAIETKHIVIATGSDVAKLKGIEIDEQRIVSSTGALELKRFPPISPSSARASSASNSAPSMPASAQRSPSSNIWTASSPAWTRMWPRTSSASCRSRASPSGSPPRSRAPPRPRTR
jgi:pyruvate/2-oxoglutarate dehydrogenase complex dihydrolipoamide dehydrogenase (E3) component